MTTLPSNGPPLTYRELCFVLHGALLAHGTRGSAAVLELAAETYALPEDVANRSGAFLARVDRTTETHVWVTLYGQPSNPTVLPLHLGQLTFTKELWERYRRATGVVQYDPLEGVS